MEYKEAVELRSARLSEYKSEKLETSKYYIMELNREQLSKMSIGELLQVMEDLPKLIYEKSVFVGHSTLEIVKIDRELKLIEAKELQIVNKDTELKNQTQREAQLTINLQSNNTYIELQQYLSELQSDKNLFNFQREYYTDLNRNLKIEVRIRHEINMMEKGMMNKGDE